MVPLLIVGPSGIGQRYLGAGVPGQSRTRAMAPWPGGQGKQALRD